MSTLGERLKQLRKEKGLNQKELGTAMGMSQGVVSTHENNRMPKADELIAYSQFFEVTTDYLLGLSPDRRLGAGKVEKKLSALAQVAGKAAVTEEALVSLLDAAILYYGTGAKAGSAPMDALHAFLPAMTDCFAAAAAQDVPALLDAVNRAAAAALDANRTLAAFIDNTKPAP